MSKVIIEASRYKELLDNETKLNMLEAGGVDNWEWYGESLNPDFGPSYAEACEQNEQIIDEAENYDG